MVSMAPKLEGGIGYEQPVNPGAGGLGVASSIAGLFAKSFEKPTAPTEDEKLDQKWREFTSQLPEDRNNISIADATLAERNEFGKLYPSLHGKVNTIAEGARSPSAIMPKLNDEAVSAYVKTPRGAVDLVDAQLLYPQATDMQMSYLLQKAAEASTDAAEKEALALSKSRMEDLVGLQKETWTGVGSRELSVFARTATQSLTDVTDYLILNPGGSFNVADVPGLAVHLPGINKITMDNLSRVQGALESSILTIYREQITNELGFDVGLPPKEIVDEVFRDFRNAGKWAEQGVSTDAIKDRLQRQGIITASEILTPKQMAFFEWLSPKLGGLAPDQQKQLIGQMGALTSAISTIMGGDDPDLGALKDGVDWDKFQRMSYEELASATSGLSFLAASLGGNNPYLEVFEEVDAGTKDILSATAAIGAFETNNIAALRDGQDGLLSLDAYKQLIEGRGDAFRGAKEVWGPEKGAEWSSRMGDVLTGDLVNEHTNLLNSIPKMAYGTEGEAGVAKRTHDVVLRDNKLVVVPTQETQAEIERLQWLIEKGRAGELPRDNIIDYRSGRYNDQLDKILGVASGIDLTELNGKITIIRDLGMAEGDLGYQVLQTFGAKPGVFDRMPEQVGAEAAQLIAEREAGIISAGTADVLEHGAYTPPPDVAADAGFMSAVEATANNIGFPSNWLLRAIGFETAGSFDPAVKNPNSTATGLIQFMESTAKGLGTSTAELAQMTAEEQMSWVNKYLLPYKGKIKNFGDLYMAIHYPIAVGRPDEYVLYRDDGTTTSEYAVNKTLDSNGDGTVTRGEAVANAFARAGGGRGGLGTTAYTQAGAEDIAGAPLPPTSGGESGFIASGPLGAPAPQTFAPETSPRPEARPESVEAGVFTGKGGESAPMPTPETDPSVLQLVENTTGKTRAWFDEQGLPPNTPIYSSMEAAEKAADEGRLPKGARVAVVDSNGVMQVVEVE